MARKMNYDGMNSIGTQKGTSGTSMAAQQPARLRQHEGPTRVRATRTLAARSHPCLERTARSRWLGSPAE